MPHAVPADDLVHTPSPNPGWRESYYFDFYDERLGLGLWHSIGKKPFKGYSGFTIGIFGPDTLVGVGRDRFAKHTDEHVVNGLRYECLVPNERWRLTFDGELARPPLNFRLDRIVFLPEGNKRFPRVPVSFDLTFVGTVPSYKYHERPEWDALFTGHMDQTGHTTGTLTIAGKIHRVDGLGARDRSWGTRDWRWPRRWRYIELPSDGLNIMLWYAEGDGGVRVIDGFLHDGSGIETIVDYQEDLRVEPAELKPVPKSFRITVKAASGRSVTVTGDVLQVMPVVFSKEEPGKTVHSWNDRSMVRYRLPDGRTAYGEIEFAERVEVRRRTPGPV
jgi:hypothetical protein